MFCFPSDGTVPDPYRLYRDSVNEWIRITTRIRSETNADRKCLRCININFISFNFYLRNRKYWTICQDL